MSDFNASWSTLLIDDGIDILPSTKEEVAWECYSSKNGSSSNTINPRKLGHTKCHLLQKK